MENIVPENWNCTTAKITSNGLNLAKEEKERMDELGYNIY